MTLTQPTQQRAQGETLALAEFASKLRLADVPAATVERIRNCTLDTIGCVAFGSTQPWSQTLNRWIQQQGGKPEASLWTTDFRGPASLVSLGVGTMGHAFDLDDYHNAKLHPGTVIVPTALAVAEARNIGGERTLTAIVAGYEVMLRTSLAAGPGPARMRGWHLTGICGTFGAAAAVANLLGLDTETTAWALGMAGTQSAGLWAFIADGSWSKRFHPGRAAQSGIMAAELAELGYVGPKYILENADGGWLAAVTPSPEPAKLVEGLGSKFWAGETAIKPYAACGSLHSSIDAVLKLVKEYDIKFEDVEQVILRTSSVVVRQCGFVFNALGLVEAQMSAQYIITVTLMDRQCLPAQVTEAKMKDPRVRDMARRVQIIIDPVIEEEYPGKFSAIVDMVLKDGRRVSTKIDNPRGSAAVPLTNEDVREKFMGLSQGIYPQDRQAAIVEKVGGIENLASIRELTGLLAK